MRTACARERDFVELYLAAVEAFEARDRPQDSRLARPRQAHQRNDFATRHAQVDTPQDFARATRELNDLDLENGVVAHTESLFQRCFERPRQRDSGSDMAR